VSEVWHPIIGALLWAPIGLLVPRALGVGYDVIDDALAGRLAVATLAALVIGKLVMWWLALASGTSGGTLAPILLISACAGALAGEGLHVIVPSVSPNAFALVAMAATFGAATRAPFAAIVFVFELTRDYNVVLPLMGATVLAEMIARALLRESIMTEKLARRSVSVPGEYRPDVMATTRVREIMSNDVQTLPAGTTLGQAVDRFLANGHSAYPVVDPNGACVGVVTRADVLGANGDAAVVDDLATPPISVRPDDLAILVLQTMLDEDVDHLTVLDGERLVGICTRTDLLRARHALQRADETEPGWIGRLRRGEG
jgi:chloride channel protein, CIC family